MHVNTFLQSFDKLVFNLVFYCIFIQYVSIGFLPKSIILLDYDCLLRDKIVANTTLDYVIKGCIVSAVVITAAVPIVGGISLGLVTNASIITLVVSLALNIIALTFAAFITFKSENDIDILIFPTGAMYVATWISTCISIIRLLF